MLFVIANSSLLRRLKILTREEEMAFTEQKERMSDVKKEASSSKVVRKPLTKFESEEMAQISLSRHKQVKDRDTYQKIVNNVTDPICGMTVDDKKAEFASEYEGTKFYFCSAGCKASFNKDPNKYLHK